MKGCFNLSNFKIVTKNMGKICKYHKRRGQEFYPNDLVRGFCSQAFFTAYPYCLALLYNAIFKKDIIVLSCPNPEGIIFQVKRIPSRNLPLKMIKKAFTHIGAKLFYPIDWEDWNIKISVIQESSHCSAKLKNGYTYWFNINRLTELCPASFYTLYPFLVQGFYKHKSLSIHCPDHEGITYNLK